MTVGQYPQQPGVQYTGPPQMMPQMCGQNPPAYNPQAMQQPQMMQPGMQMQQPQMMQPGMQMQQPMMQPQMMQPQMQQPAPQVVIQQQPANPQVVVQQQQPNPQVVVVEQQTVVEPVLPRTDPIMLKRARDRCFKDMVELLNSRIQHAQATGQTMARIQPEAELNAYNDMCGELELHPNDIHIFVQNREKVKRDLVSHFLRAGYEVSEKQIGPPNRFLWTVEARWGAPAKLW